MQADGGDLRLVEVTQDGVVRLELTGVCGTCQMSEITLKYGIERLLKVLVPEVERVEQVKPGVATK